MERSLRDVVNLYNPHDPLEEAWTIPAPWYFDERISQNQAAPAFSAQRGVGGRADQVRDNGQFFTAELGQEPLIICTRMITASCVPFTMYAAITPPPSSPKRKAAQNSFAAPTTAGPTACTMARVKGMRVDLDGVCN